MGTEYIYLKKPEEADKYIYSAGSFVMVCEIMRDQAYRDFAVKGNWLQYQMCMPYFVIYMN